MGRAVLCLLLWGCGPVLLGEEEPLPLPDTNDSAGARAGAGAMGDAATATAGASAQDAGARPEVVVRVRPLDCGRCFELSAEGAGGEPPYEFAWQDGSSAALREVCVEDAAVSLSVVASDANDVQSVPHGILLEAGTDAGCPEPGQPDAGAAAQLCLLNPSFEGTPAPDFGLDPAFDAPPWNTCTNPVRTNMPRIGSDATSVTGSVPPPVDGVTYMALGEGDQVSQLLCSELVSGVPVHFEVDLARIDLGGQAVPQTERMFLEVWGGRAADCSQSERLWMSSALVPGWQTFCVTLRPSATIDQLTLRGGSDMSLASPAYLLVDNLQPVDSCP